MGGACYITHTKLRPPSSPHISHLIGREHLLAKLRAGATYRALIIAAPPGYGKTTLLAELMKIEQRLAWYSLDNGDLDLSVFLSYLLEGIAERVPDVDAVRELREQVASEDVYSRWEPILSQLINRLDQVASGGLVIAMDDFQAVQDSERVCRALDYLIRYAPAGVRFALASRTNPNLLCLPKLRATGQALDITRDDLEFDRREVCRLLRDIYGVELSPEEAAILQKETEGWPLALHLAGQTSSTQGRLRGKDSSHSRIGRTYLFSYLAAEVVGQQNEEVRSFLLQSSVLPRLHARICDEVLQRSDSATMLEYLREHNLFLTDIDDDWACYHHLFHEFLRAQLAKDVHQFRELHRRAATYFANLGDVPQAVPHWFAAGGHHHAAPLIALAAPQLIQVGQLDTLANWIDQLPGSVFDEFPELGLHRGRVHELLGEWDQALAWYDRARKAYLLRRDMRGMVAAVRRQDYLFAWRKTDQSHAALLNDQALQQLGEEHRLERAGLLSNLAWLDHLITTRQPKVAVEAFEEAMAIYESAGDERAKMEAIIEGGYWLHGFRGDHRRAIELLEIAEQIARALGDKCKLAECHNLMGTILYFMGDARRLRECAEQALRLSRETRSVQEEARALENLAQAYVLEPEHEGRHPEAIHLFQQALDLEIDRESWGPAMATLDFGSVALRREGKVDEAIEWTTRALGIARKHTTMRWFMAHVLFSLGACQAAGCQKEAGDTLQQALEIFEQYGDKYHLAATHFWLAWHYRTVNRSRSLEHVGRCLELVTRHGRYALLEHEPNESALLLHDALAANSPSPLAHLALDVAAKLRVVDPTFLTSLVEHPDPTIRQKVVEMLGGKVGVDTDQSPRPRLTADAVALTPTASVGPTDRTIGRIEPPRIECLGPLIIWRGDKIVTEGAWRHRRAKSLLGYLLQARGRSVVKDAVIDQLWGEMDADEACNHLYRAIYDLRLVLEPEMRGPGSHYLLLKGGVVRLAESVAVDADEFEARVEAGRRYEQAGATALAVSQYLAAVKLYKGDFLADSLYEDWLDPRRTRLRNLHISTLSRLAELSSSQGRWSEAEAYLRKALETDSTLEELHARLIVTLARAGNQKEALDQYEVCRRILRQELDVEPSGETKRLKERLLAGDRL